MSDPVKGLIEEDTDIGNFRLAALRDGMRTHPLSRAQKVPAGATTIDEVRRVALFSGAE